jgi:hypothetical protein
MPMGVSNFVFPGPTGRVQGAREYPKELAVQCRIKLGPPAMDGRGLALREEGGVRKTKVPRTPPWNYS